MNGLLCDLDHHFAQLTRVIFSPHFWNQRVPVPKSASRSGFEQGEAEGMDPEHQLPATNDPGMAAGPAMLGPSTLAGVPAGSPQVPSGSNTVSSTGSTQLLLPLTDLPTPPFVEDHVRVSDQRISKLNAHLKNRGNPYQVYLQLLKAGEGTAKYPCRYRYPQMGYDTLGNKIRERCGVVISKTGVIRAIDLLKYLGYVQRVEEARKGTIAAKYAVLTPRGVVEMFRHAGVRYFRLIREKDARKIQLIKPKDLMWPINPRKLPSRNC
jgi:hypothetical protein